MNIIAIVVFHLNKNPIEYESPFCNKTKGHPACIVPAGQMNWQKYGDAKPFIK